MVSSLLSLSFLRILKQEFRGYSWSTFRQDALAGITVGAVALPLALAFGVAGGADAAAGLVTAILAGMIIAAFGGASFQISGPTGAMSAVLIVLSHRYGLPGVWVSCVIAGVLLILLGVFRFGRYISFIPSSVITGFTSGIALIIAIGEIDHVLGIKTPPAENALAKLLSYLTNPPIPDWHAMVIAGLVILIMVITPRITRAIPGSLVGLIAATLVVSGLGWSVHTIGSIPRTILLENRLTWETIPWGKLQELLPSSVAITALGAIESLLCGSVGANMTGKAFDSNQELIGQGIGNLIIPFFGGVPATAAIARTSVAIKSGGVTRLTSIIHAVMLLLSVFVLSSFISRIPLAALGGVLLVTAWRMNEWETIHFFTTRRIRHAMVGLLVTMIATVALDLTQAILIGIAISALLYLRQSSKSTTVTSAPVDPDRLRSTGYQLDTPLPSTHIYYLSGPLFFGSVHSVLEAFKTSTDYRTVIISMRGVPLIDVTGLQALIQIIEKQQHHGGEICLSGIQPAVEADLRKAGILEMVGNHNIFWSADQAIKTLDMRQRATRLDQLEGQEPVYLPFPSNRTVADVMNREIYTVAPTTPAEEIVSLLLDKNLRWLPVVDEHHGLIGVISEGDLLRREVIRLPLTMKQLLPLQERASAVLALAQQHQTAAELVTTNPVTVRDTESLVAAAQLMATHTLKRLPVLNAENKLVGILTRSDLLGTVMPTPISLDTAASYANGHPRYTVGDVVNRDVLTVTPTTPLVEVLRGLLRSPHKRAFVLRDEHLVGLITDGDVLKHMARQTHHSSLRRLLTRMTGSDIPEELHGVLQGRVAADIMTSRVVVAQTNTPIVTAIQDLVTEDVVGMPVVDEQQHFQGWVERGDLLRALVHTPTTPTGIQPVGRS